MFKFFKRNGKKKSYYLVDIDGVSIKIGDKVEALRYELGDCNVIDTEQGVAYESIDSGKIVSFAKMIDANTKYQKVRKIDGE